MPCRFAGWLDTRGIDRDALHMCELDLNAMHVASDGEEVGRSAGGAAAFAATSEASPRAPGPRVVARRQPLEFHRLSLLRRRPYRPDPWCNACTRVRGLMRARQMIDAGCIYAASDT